MTRKPQKSKNNTCLTPSNKECQTRVILDEWNSKENQALYSQQDKKLEQHPFLRVADREAGLP